MTTKTYRYADATRGDHETITDLDGTVLGDIYRERSYWVANDVRTTAGPGHYPTKTSAAHAVGTGTVWDLRVTHISRTGGPPTISGMGLNWVVRVSFSNGYTSGNCAGEAWEYARDYLAARLDEELDR